jgi:hypothetical protein
MAVTKPDSFMSYLIHYTAAVLEKRPSLGYIGATLPGLGVVMNVITDATTVLTFLSVLIGLGVGVLTLLIQLRNWKQGSDHKKELDADDDANDI